MKKYKFITIRQERDEAFCGMPVYRVFANRKGGQLAIISYYVPWKEYVFSSHEDCVFNNSCLRDVLDFIENVIPSLQKSQVKSEAGDVHRT
jgi:hypothetical protein